MFAEFFLEPYQRIYRYWRERGVQLIVHHSDSYAATLVPAMIEMGVDVWQGVLKSSDIPSLVKEHGGKMAFMGGIDNSIVDVRGWTEELVEREVGEMCASCGPLYFVPCWTVGDDRAESGQPGLQDAIDRAIDACSRKMLL